MNDTGAEDPNVVDAELVEGPAAGLSSTSGPAVGEPDYTGSDYTGSDYTESGVPGFDYVRDRIEKRLTTADATTELVGLSGGPDVAELDKKLEERDQAARDKLAEIRRSMGRE